MEVKSSEAHTSQKAELYALARALDSVEEEFGDDMKVSWVVVITDSAIWLMG